MIVDQISKSVGGGAGVAADRLHRALRSNGVDSRFWCADPPQLSDNLGGYYRLNWLTAGRPIWERAWHQVRRKFRKRRIGAELRRATEGRSPSLEVFTVPEQAMQTPYRPNLGMADVVHLHWISQLIDIPSFFLSLPNSIPIVWTLHDMNPFTGGCHYNHGCDAYLSSCQNCPQLAYGSGGDLAAKSFEIKLRALQDKHLHIVTPSQWLYREAKRSRLLRSVRSIRCIGYAIDTTVFAPMDRGKARAELGLPSDRCVVAFGAESVQNGRKGIRQLMEALAKIRPANKLVGLAIGGGDLADQQAVPIPIHRMGYVRDPQRQATAYAAADLFVLPSLEDNLPQMGIEALSCGTPVVAFDAGGIPDYVQHGVTGRLAPVGDVNALASQIQDLVIRQDQRNEFGRQGRKFVLEHYAEHVVAEAHRRFYASLLEGSKARAAA